MSHTHTHTHTHRRGWSKCHHFPRPLLPVAMAILPGPVSGGGRETDPHWVCHQPPGGGGTHGCAQTDPERCEKEGGGRREEGV